jgi:arabinogalactan oligomer/maltooligosaccharide transport system permease protein
VKHLLALLMVVLCLLPTRGWAGEIVLWHAYRGAEQEGLAAAAAAWSEQRGHTVRLVPLSFGAFDAKLETAIPRGNGPDLFIAAHGNLGKWTAMDIVQPVQVVTAAHRSPAVDAVSLDGKVWGAPLAFKSVMLLYDPQVVKVVPKTTDELLIAMDRYGTDGRYGLIYEASAPYYHAPWMHGFGGSALDGDGEGALDTPEQVAALAFAQRLAARMPPSLTTERVGALYRQGKVAMVINGPWMATDMEHPIAAAPLPVVSSTGEPARPYLTVEAIFVAQHAAEPVLAAQFAEFLASEGGARLRQDVGGQAVTWASIEATDPIVRAQLAQAAQSVPLPTHANIQSAWEAQARGLRQLLRGTATPEEAARTAQSHFDVLARPAPPAVSPWPYVVVLCVVVVGALVWSFSPLRKAGVRRKVMQHGRDYLWILPAGVAMVLLVAVPFVTGAGVAFFAHDRGEWTFVGVHHFLDILLARDWPVTSPMSFVYTLGVTVLWTLSNVALHVTIGIGLALLLREPWIRMRSMWRALLILPWAVPNYITALIWKTMFDAQYGAVNQLLTLAMFSSEPVQVDWFGSFATGFAANLVTNTWLGFPFMMVMTLGALQSIPRDLEEAAEVDGANAWQRFWNVTWPLLRPALLPAVILGSVWTFNMFNVVYLVSAGEPDGSTEILISEAYRWAFSRGNRYGYAAAYAVLIFGVLLLYSRGVNHLAGRKVI